MTTRPTLQLFLTSATVLFVELALIRWIPSNIVYVGFFNNFILIASFLGIGLGIVLGRRGGRTVPFAPVLLVLALLVAITRIGAVADPIDLFLGAPSEVHVDGVVLAALVALVVAAMAALAMPLGPLLRAFPPLRAYAIDIAGSLLGIAAFAAMSVLGAPPAVWFGLVLVAVVALETLGRARRPRRLLSAVSLGAVVLVAWGASGNDVWSPYNRITQYTLRDGTGALAVNGIPHQHLWPAAATSRGAYFDQVYRWYPERTFERALIVGAGTGSDVTLALAHGVKEIDAVEIDPAILAIGVAEHPDRPYSDPRVHRFVDDGRAFLRSTDRRYDLVIFAQTDSLTLVTATANLRLESFLFTEEAFASVRDHLDPGGVFALANTYRQPWLVERYRTMLARTFGSAPLVATYPQYGDARAAALAVRNDAPVTAVPIDPTPDGIEPATDDHPFPYLRDRAIAPDYLVALVALLLGAAVTVAAGARATGLAARLFSAHFFALGAAFLLLETKSLVSFSLLFGTTWIVNVLVFAGILLSVLAAVGVTAVHPRIAPRVLYAGLFLSLVAAYVIPPSSLLFDPAPLRYVVASALVFAPVFFANLVFARDFKDTDAADMAFASNLLGAVLGGVLEWTAVLVGYQQLSLIVAALYALAYATSREWIPWKTPISGAFRAVEQPGRQ